MKGKSSALIFGLLLTQPVAGFTLITWNVAEYSDNNPDRLHSLLSMIHERSPDVILLQEVERQTLLLADQPKIGLSGYRILQREDAAGFPEGGLVALVKKDLAVSGTRYERFPSEMDRGELIFTLDKVCGIPHTVTSVHLESPDPLFWRSRAFRDQQVEQLKAQSEQQAGWLVAGDLNLVLKWDADQFFPKNWVDAWLSLHSDEPGLTWDPDDNDMAYWGGGFILPGYRLDRVLFKSEQLTPLKVERLGVGVKPPLSDHYGLLVEFGCRQNVHH